MVLFVTLLFTMCRLFFFAGDTYESPVVSSSSPPPNPPYGRQGCRLSVEQIVKSDDKHRLFQSLKAFLE